eukprot:TRINITY_DN2769_c0_g1_i2.p1 TRINITY_DN2769_c0_g1~~TRINITY_DN2769_c0_g1_i2.p1  ORF type:complete len:259 (-),score=32.32 TRINITY_DN2769_c0_g1_i2:45-821(-)
MESNQPIVTKGDVLWDLPKEMVILILSFLPLGEMKKASMLSRTMREFTNNDLLWKIRYERSYIERGTAIPIKPLQETWKDCYKTLVYFSTFIEGGDEIDFKYNVAKMNRDCARTAFGRFHYSGKHKYTVRIDQQSYIGVGVASTRLTGEVVKIGAMLHQSYGCSVYYYTGIWYGQESLTGKHSASFNENDQIHVYFDVESGQVEYYNGSKLLVRCHTIGEDEHKDGLRLGVILRAQRNTPAMVSIVDYQPIDAFPTPE